MKTIIFEFYDEQFNANVESHSVAIYQIHKESELTKRLNSTHPNLMAATITG